ncbi:MAG TPA: pyridoxamine 5'-phosphate oxidase family protein [Acidimicrobiales bacterium]|nr:pyridoxamine 5'-phosphate oxidase family protein [Acidimicrobiales bacterium]
MTTLGSEPTAAEHARRIAGAAREGFLATLAVDPPGTPFGSLVAFVLEPSARPLLCLSDLAEHSRNLSVDSRASLMAVEPNESDHTDGLARGRVTLLGTCHRVPDNDLVGARAAYLAAHPEAFYVDFADFGFYRLHVEQVRWVGGFGAMNWVDADAYASASISAG